ncbi:hypothetical protein JCM8097_002605 [Rhodosporidiobolus ruineniae]
MPASPAQSASSPSSRGPSLLVPLPLDSVAAVHLHGSNQVVQVSLRADKDEKNRDELVRLYQDVHEDMTVSLKPPH